MMPYTPHVLVALVLSLCTPLVLRAQNPTTRPNIVVILADDMGFSDAGCYGGEIPTPNIDALAAHGVRFTQFYNNAWCCPSRASLLTGRFPHQVGIGTNIDGYTKWMRDAANSPAYGDQLTAGVPTMGDLMRAAGYHTMMIGKWHLGYRPDAWPARRGFDRSFALVGGAMNYWGSETDGKPAQMSLNGETFVPPKDGFFATDAFTDRAVEFLNEAAKGATPKDGAAAKPFLMYLAYNAPHWPLHARPAEIEKHRGKYRKPWQAVREVRYERLRKLGVIDDRVALAPMERGNVKPWSELTDAERDEWDLRMAVYAAMVEGLDAGVGRVMQTLRDAGVAENTLVLFVSDNGGAAEDPGRGPASAATGTRDSFRGYARPWASVSNTPFFRNKVTVFEGGISAPMIAHWPAGIPKEKHGQFVREPAHLIDLLPSFLELAGAAPTDESFKPEGQSIVPMMKGNSGNPDRTFAWEHDGHRGLRKGKWKIVRLPSDAQWSLFDMEADRAEQNDLAAKQPDVLREMVAAYDAWAKRCGVIPWEELEPKRPPAAPAQRG
jgi:arylsulfatase A-like enzyme